MDGLISFFASHHAIRAEVVLKRGGFPSRLVPGPRELSPNCGVALRFQYADRERVLDLLTSKRVQIDGVHVYRPRTDQWDAGRVPRPSTLRQAQGRPEQGRGTTSAGRPEHVEGRSGPAET